MLELGHELGLALQTAQNLASLAGAELAVTAQGVADSVEPVRETHQYRVLNQEIIGRMAEGAGRFINWLIYAGVIACVVFAGWGFIRLNRAADSPQLRNSAIGQIACSVIAAAGITMVWVFVGFGVEFGDVISGGSAVDVGSIGTGGTTANEVRPAGDLIGFYGQSAVICNDEVASTTLNADGDAEWAWTAADETMYTELTTIDSVHLIF